MLSLDMLELPEEKLNQIKKKGFSCVEDLLFTYPRRFFDYSNPVSIDNATSGEKCSMLLILDDIRKDKTKTGISYVTAFCKEASTYTNVKVVWFSQPYKYKELYSLVGMTFVCGGTFTYDEYGFSFNSPDVFSTDIDGSLSVYPMYSAVKGMSDSYYRSIIDKALSLFNGNEKFSSEVLEKFNIITEKDMLYKIHKPQSREDVIAAKRRIIFEQLYTFAERMIAMSQDASLSSRYRAVNLSNCRKAIEALPFELTDDQKEVVKRFINGSKAGKRINALVQGDVGSGKTVCAFLSMISMADNGYQSVLMAPTGVLAKQHYEELKSYVEPLGFTCVYLSGDMKKSEKNNALSMIKSGAANFIVGTHSVIAKDVVYNNLGLTVIDEEHKFGVAQREALREKASDGVHCITMSATPIPRSLAMVLYGNAVDVCTIQTKPKGRLPIKTCVTNNYSAIFSFMENEIKKGHQCYIVCPTIDNCEIDSNAPIKSTQDLKDMVDGYFKNTNIHACVITGKMKDLEKSEIIHDFQQNKYQILIATTIIEVGVNVSNATTICIANAERFGLASLHQLRGRVGRNNLQSYCILESSDENNERLQVMCDTTDGFEISKRDLAIRGTGDLLGTKQSGDNETIQLMLQYPKLYNVIKRHIEQGDSLNL